MIIVRQSWTNSAVFAGIVGSSSTVKPFLFFSVTSLNLPINRPFTHSPTAVSLNTHQYSQQLAHYAASRKLSLRGYA